ncbi:tetratricopeptide repeat-containing sulfotransferase family protein [Nisaea sediminum]|uniref:tetratricopeptide repeat-containing sulfotransferase family protein n=1 Tax=Nisaea sediminum TaxID=2775867 RepID=UPI0018690E2C|nr:tetratricopeptide repeat-containing sulfotransferase family protein [Nisaea sediminum]
MAAASYDLGPIQRLASGGRWREAREKYARVLRKAGGDWRPYYAIGMLEASGGHFDRAEQLLEKARSLAPATELQVAVNLAQVRFHKGAAAAAAELLGPIAGRLRENPQVQKLHGSILLELGRYDEAALALETALAQGDDPAVLNNLAVIYRSQWNLPRAAEMLERAARRDDGIEIRSNLASIYLSMGRSDAAKERFEELLRRDTGDPRVLRALAQFCRETGDLARAVRMARRAVTADPGQTASLRLLAELLDRQSALDEALRVATNGGFLAPHDQFLTALRGRVLRRLKRHDEAKSLLAPALTGIAQGPDTFRLGFELAQTLDALGECEEALEWFETANRVQFEEFRDGQLDPGRAFSEVAELAAVFTKAPAWAKQEAASAPGESDPVFLVGFPRSGTTLLDQVLDAHPSVEVLEERPLITNLALRLRAEGVYPGALETLPEQKLADLRSAYFAERSRFMVPSEGAVYVDKMPLNIVHAGLIRRLFPRARFILALRHPCDVCLSCLMQNFSLNHSMAVFCSLDDTIRFYREVFSLWERYMETLDPSVVTVKYEDMTRDLRSSTEPVLNFLGLDWDERLLAFHEHARSRGYIATPSYAQVTQPLYGHAVARWQRYGPKLMAAAEELHAEIERFGYGD